MSESQWPNRTPEMVREQEFQRERDFAEAWRKAADKADQLQRELSQAKADLASVLDTDGAIKTLRTELHKQDDKVQELRRENERLAKEVAELNAEAERMLADWTSLRIEVTELRVKLAMARKLLDAVTG